mmetsp:Transcript_26286/g.38844  ORF Transcript_26286/g.38844 Transcript_26286/m.38844 type:complete len:117 (+) Transcript_26286:59-409(+)|eukprot:CAMPEP_0194208128 /NCGR_PEP_ID=MMETSP0156-20130528/6664_1 /TAXON_ID=33649 /ORGANISM="Thalassionema nitzschioides, Strain L26-B" /LENGTH=116 /DNA_ID=CAMNT_0038935029 /DNA_START=55 /DNA_END=405 /DNA_ORIENTATION=-
MSEQPDGSYPRINGKVLKSGEYVNKIVSLVGKVEVFDGTSIQLTCSDGVIASVQCETDAEVMQGSTYELIGLSNDNGTLQLFVSRELTQDMDVDLYNRMILDVQHNPKFSGYFLPA